MTAWNLRQPTGKPRPDRIYLRGKAATWVYQLVGQFKTVATKKKEKPVDDAK